MEFEEKLVDLSQRDIFSIAGKDAYTFLQNILSNDLDRIVKDKLQYSLLLSPGGKILYDFFIFRIKEKYYLDTTKSNLQEIFDLLHKYKLGAAINIKREKLQLTLGDIKICDLSFIDPRCSKLGYRSYTLASQESTQSQTEYKRNSYTVKRLRYLVPESGHDFYPNSHLALDLDMYRLDAISFTKGCFVGQEVIAKIFYRGKNKKILNYVMLEKTLKVMEGHLYKGDLKIGKVIKCYDDGILINKNVLA
jgi:folate-binding protein YgfZ